MSSGSSEYVEYIMEQLSAIAGLTSGRFFGGIGLSASSAQFAMVMGNSLYFAVDDATRPKYEQTGSNCFSYNTKNGRVQVKRYFLVPAAALEDRGALVALAEEAIQVAHRSKRRVAKWRLTPPSKGILRQASPACGCRHRTLGSTRAAGAQCPVLQSTHPIQRRFRRSSTRSCAVLRLFSFSERLPAIPASCSGSWRAACSIEEAFH
jgi:DNA transformation protein